jgi:hypothetical protein
VVVVMMTVVAVVVVIVVLSVCGLGERDCENESEHGVQKRFHTGVDGGSCARGCCAWDIFCLSVNRTFI